MKKLKFTFRGKDFYADMLPEEAPLTCAAVEKACPFTTRWIHAKIVYQDRRADLQRKPDPEFTGRYWIL